VIDKNKLFCPDKDFQAWLTTRDAGFSRRHLIPADSGLLRFDRFEEFIAAREAFICDRLKRLLSPAGAAEAIR